MSDQKTSKDLPSAISSPVSVDGQLPSEKRCGQTIDLFGQEAALVNRSVQQPAKKESRNLMSDTYGRPLQGSSNSVALQRSLESRLMKLSPRDGWTMPFTTWKRRRTPALRQYCQFTMSKKLLREADFSLWPTPLTSDSKGSSTGSKKIKNGEISMCRYFLHFHYAMGRQDKTCYPHPLFAAALMGYSAQHHFSMLSAMLSIRGSRQNSSKRVCKEKK